MALHCRSQFIQTARLDLVNWRNQRSWKVPHESPLGDRRSMAFLQVDRPLLLALNASIAFDRCDVTR